MTTPSQLYRRSEIRQPERIHEGLDAVVHGVAGRVRQRRGVFRELARQAKAVVASGAVWQDLDEAALRAKLYEFRERFRRGGRLADECLVDALAALREAAQRKLGLKPFAVQIHGVLALHRGFLAEMATGEGKTLVAGMAAILAGWSGRPCHVITVNDYLVKRDASWMRPLFRFAGILEGSITGEMSPDERREEYRADVVYTTGKELLADFLRDRLRIGQLRYPGQRLIRQLLRPGVKALPDSLVLRGLGSVIVDEADSVLIDEAVTPLIISASKENKILAEVVVLAEQVVNPLRREVDYRVDSRFREVELTEFGRKRISEACQPLPGIWQSEQRREELLKQALVAREFYRKGEQYVVSKGKVVIVDEFTGRAMPERSWRQGIHQAIEAKEGLKISDPSETSARMSYQRFFRLFHHLSGMTGTGAESSRELWRVYQLPVMRIPTNRPVARVERRDRIYTNESDKLDAMVAEVRERQSRGQPVLIGTRTVAQSEKVAALLDRARISYHLLNATYHQEEARIIAQAGERGAVTIATNMAGRGTDIRLAEGVAELGGLCVLASERHESGRIDRQLFGRSGRQGDPGSAQAFVSLEDEILTSLPGWILRLTRLVLKTGFPGRSAAVRFSVWLAQRRKEKQAAKQRRQVLKMDNWMEESLAFTGLNDW